MAVSNISIATDPLRPRDWRWKRAQLIAHKDKPSYAAFDDEHVKRAVKYLRARNQLDAQIRAGRISDPDAAAYARLGAWGDIRSADNIWTSSKFMRWAIEALVLTGMSCAEMAAAIGCSTDVVEAFETYFYDVRSRHGTQLYILNELLSPALTTGATVQDCDFYWKGLAYWCGADVLKSYWTYNKLPDETRKKLIELFESSKEKTTVRASMARVVNQFNAHDIIDEYLTDKQITEGSKNMTEIEEKMANGTATLLKAIGFAVASTSAGSGAIEGRVGSNIKVLASGNNSDTTGVKRVIDLRTVEVSASPASGENLPRVTISELPRAAEVNVTVVNKEDARQALMDRKAELMKKLRR